MSPITSFVFAIRAKLWHHSTSFKSPRQEALTKDLVEKTLRGHLQLFGEKNVINCEKFKISQITHSKIGITVC